VGTFFPHSTILRAATADFGRQGRHSNSHFTGEPLLPLMFSISQNPAKGQALAALPPVDIAFLSAIIHGVFHF
jgi:hypothetical protein